MSSDDYLYAVDLYNFGYWWESHEVFEALWHAAGHNTEQGHFFRALIQFAAANLKRSTGHWRPAERLLMAGLTRLEQVPDVYMGLEVRRFSRLVQDALLAGKDPAVIRLLV